MLCQSNATSVTDLPISRDDACTHVADIRDAACARSHIHLLAVPVSHLHLRTVATKLQDAEGMIVEAKNPRLCEDALPVADGILFEAFVGLFTGGDAGVVLFVRSGQVDDVGRGDESADREEALVLREQVV